MLSLAPPQLPSVQDWRLMLCWRRVNRMEFRASLSRSPRMTFAPEGRGREGAATDSLCVHLYLFKSSPPTKDHNDKGPRVQTVSIANHCWGR